MRIVGKPPKTVEIDDIALNVGDFAEKTHIINLRIGDQAGGAMACDDKILTMLVSATAHFAVDQDGA